PQRLEPPTPRVQRVRAHPGDLPELARGQLASPPRVQDQQPLPPAQPLATDLRLRLRRSPVHRSLPPAAQQPRRTLRLPHLVLARNGLSPAPRLQRTRRTPRPQLREQTRFSRFASFPRLYFRLFFRTDFHLARLAFVALRHHRLLAAYAASGSSQLLH